MVLVDRPDLIVAQAVGIPGIVWRVEESPRFAIKAVKPSAKRADPEHPFLIFID